MYHSCLEHTVMILKFLKIGLANSADPDQTAPRSSLSGSSLFAIPFACFFTKYLQLLPLCLNLR